MTQDSMGEDSHCVCHVEHALEEYGIASESRGIVQEFVGGFLQPALGETPIKFRLIVCYSALMNSTAGQKPAGA